MEFYHVARPNNVGKIFKEGLKANEGEIFLFSQIVMRHPWEKGTIYVPADIAKKQCFLSKYALIAVNSKGITGELVQDIVVEYTTVVQYILKQEIINPKYLTFFNRAEELKLFDYICAKKQY